MRIVSLLGSATEIVFELGLGRHLVGISHECDYPPEATTLPRVSRPRFDPAGLTSGEVDAAVRRTMERFGSVYQVDENLLASLRPDLVLTQAVCEVCAVPTGSALEAVANIQAEVEVVSLDAHTLAGILSSIRQVADAAGISAVGSATADRLRARIDGVAEQVADRPPPTVLLVEWLDPPFNAGHWVPEMVKAAGGRNLLGSAGERSRQIAWHELGGLDPDVLLIEPCGYDLEQARADADRHRDRLSTIGGRAIEDGRAWLLHSAWFSRSGPRVVEGVEVLGRIFHPAVFAEPPLGGRARRWC